MEKGENAGFGGCESYHQAKNNQFNEEVCCRYQYWYIRVLLRILLKKSYFDHNAHHHIKEPLLQTSKQERHKGQSYQPSLPLLHLLSNPLLATLLLNPLISLRPPPQHHKVDQTYKQKHGHKAPKHAQELDCSHHLSFQGLSHWEPRV